MSTQSTQTVVTGTTARWAAIALIVAGMALLAVVSGVSAQTDQSWSDDFEDGDVEGWSSSDQYPTISTESIEGQYSMYSATETGEGVAEWTDGPYLDMTEEFVIEGTFRPNTINWEFETYDIRIGLSSGSPLESGENVYLKFNAQNNITFLATNRTEWHDGDVINDSFNNEWVNFEIRSQEGSNLLEAKVWNVGSGEPSDYQLTREFSGTSGNFSIDTGSDEGSSREAWLDSVTVGGTSEVSNPNVILDVQGQMDHGSTQPYRVYDRNESIGDTEVTSEATVTSSDPSIISVNESAHTLSATNDTSVAQRVQITATVDGASTVKNVTVANVTLQNIHILPRAYWIEALVTDSTIQWTFLASLFGALVGRVLRNPWVAIGTIESLLLIGWVGAWVTTGLMATSVFSLLAVALTLMQVRKKRN